jgi:hypothetical protein
VTTKLEIFNAALDELGETNVSDTGEAIESARVLVRRYDRVVADCLATGSWNFAMETIQADADTGVTPSFGYAKVFAKPSDWVNTVAISADPYFTFPLTQYVDDVNFWSSDYTPIYVRYVSNDTGLGLELARWTPAFTRFVELELAHRSCIKITQSETTKERIAKDLKTARRKALADDALNEPQPKFPPPGSWSMSRSGRIGLRDRGNRNSLIG